ncbi:hypothetical protein [Phocaeicola sartorii]|uniref:hypothetical protein n=1 Tax=Phocaeicola sartorii TaxID=671267 RepID=UPI003513AF7C
MNNFFGYESGDKSFNRRRHVNLVFQVSMSHRFSVPELGEMIFQYRKNKKTEQVVSWIEQSILSKEEVIFLKYLANRYGLSEQEYSSIVGMENIDDMKIKTPINYNIEESVVLILHLFTAQYLAHQTSEKQHNTFQYNIGVSNNWIVGLGNAMGFTTEQLQNIARIGSPIFMQQDYSSQQSIQNCMIRNEKYILNEIFE